VAALADLPDQRIDPLHCFHERNPRTLFAPSWHYEVIAAKLEAVREGCLRRLIINVPPRYLKSHLVSITFPAWCLGYQPSAQILCASYAQELADKLSRDCRRIMMSDWYQRLFPNRLSPRHQAVPEFETTAQGCRLATSVGGVLTGRGADLIIIDDPLKPEEALSQAQRRAANEWFDHTLYCRLNDKRQGGIVLVMLRVHEDDLVGHVMAQDDWELVGPLGRRRRRHRASGSIEAQRQKSSLLTRRWRKPDSNLLYRGRRRACGRSLRAQHLVARIDRLAARGGRYRRAAPVLTSDIHRAIQSEPRSPSSHPEAAAQSDELGGL